VEKKPRGGQSREGGCWRADMGQTRVKGGGKKRKEDARKEKDQGLMFEKENVASVKS